MKNWFGNIKIERKCVIIAGIDHTLLFFKNKQIINQEEIRTGNYEVIYDRDARLCRIKNVSTGKVTSRFEFEDIKTDNFMFEERCYYFHPYWLAKICEKILPKEKTYLSFLKRFNDDEIDVIAYETVQYNAIFVISQEATYVLLGGYGHNANPYTHFYHRGYGEEFEAKMKQMVLVSATPGPYDIEKSSLHPDNFFNFNPIIDGAWKDNQDDRIVPLVIRPT